MSERYITTAAGFTFCRDCGALIMAGYAEEHDRMHPDIKVDEFLPGYFVSHKPWEEVYPRRPDSRATG